MRKLLLVSRMSRPMPYDPAMASAPSPLAAALERVGDRWSLLLVEALLPGPRRFGELSEAVQGIAPNILADRLRRLESERVVRATPSAARPWKRAGIAPPAPAPWSRPRPTRSATCRAFSGRSMHN